MSRTAFFREGRLRRNLTRNNRPCPKCAKKRSVCLICTRVVCEECGHACTGNQHVGGPGTTEANPLPAMAPTNTVSRVRLRARTRIQQLFPVGCEQVWPIAQRLGATGIHASVDDPDSFVVVIATKGRSLADVLKLLWSDSEWNTLAHRDNISAGDTKWPTEAHCLFRLREVAT